MNTLRLVVPLSAASVSKYIVFLSHLKLKCETCPLSPLSSLPSAVFRPISQHIHSYFPYPIPILACISPALYYHQLIFVCLHYTLHSSAALFVIGYAISKIEVNILKNKLTYNTSLVFHQITILSPVSISSNFKQHLFISLH